MPHPSTFPEHEGPPLRKNRNPSLHFCNPVHPRPFRVLPFPNGPRGRHPGGVYQSHFDFEHNALFYFPRIYLPPRILFSPPRCPRGSWRSSKSQPDEPGAFHQSSQSQCRSPAPPGRIPYTLFKQGTPQSPSARKVSHRYPLCASRHRFFLAGVDVPGEALSCLMWTSFPSTRREILWWRRASTDRSQGGNPFMDYQLPSAIIAFKQGLGRLIRTVRIGSASVLDVG